MHSGYFQMFDRINTLHECQRACMVETIYTNCLIFLDPPLSLEEYRATESESVLKKPISEVILIENWYL